MSAPFRHATAACVLADQGSGASLADLVALLEAASLAPLVVVAPRDTLVPAPARLVVAESRRPDALTGLRFGLTQLLNVPVVGALAVDARAPVTLASVLAVLDAAQRAGTMVVRGGEGDALLWAHRDVWRDLLTASGGVDEVASRYPSVRVPPATLTPPVG